MPATPPPLGRSRAASLPPDERRRAILDAVVPLIVEHGAGVTTRQLAEAAEVAEGTLFRVFEDKAALLHAAAHAVLDPEHGRRALADVDPDLDLAQMVRTVVEQQLHSLGRAMQVLMAVRSAVGPPAGHDRPGPPAFVLESHRVVLEGLTALFERYRGELRVEPQRAALLLRALLFGCRQPWQDPGLGLTAEEIADVLVCGVRARSSEEAACSSAS